MVIAVDMGHSKAISRFFFLFSYLIQHLISVWKRNHCIMNGGF